VNVLPAQAQTSFMVSRLLRRIAEFYGKRGISLLGNRGRRMLSSRRSEQRVRAAAKLLE
jgi:hypothetical protein